MLVLTRKLQQQIKIGDDITVTVLRVKGNTVRIGVQAPREVRVVRGELPKEPPAPVTEITATEEIVMAVCDAIAEPAVTTDQAEVVASAESTSETTESTAPIRAPHLPLKRIRDRYGVAPLKQIIAACPTLAK
jgi:carbon storage regulator CsrA